MNLLTSGYVARGLPQTPDASLTFPTITPLADGTILATWRAGSGKDSADETICFARSHDGGATWSDAWRPFGDGYRLDGEWGSYRVCYVTELAPARLLAAAMWIDRSTYPGQPLFNPETEGCLPMSILLAESTDNGATWSPWRVAPMPDEIGPASLTSPVLQLHDGSLVLSIETNKQYHDRRRWMQKVVFFHSHDGGQTWGAPITAGQDPSGRIFNWDLRCGVAPDGRVVTYAWTYDSDTARYLNIHRRISHDHGHTWSDAEDLGFADQAARPAILPDGRVLLAYVDRFGSRSIRARLAPTLAAPFDPAHEVVIYTHDPAQAEAGQDENTGALLAEMGVWTFGLPYAEALPDGDVLVVYYAGNDQTLDIRWARLRP